MLGVCTKHNAVVRDVKHVLGTSPVCWQCVAETRVWISRLWALSFVVPAPSNENSK